MIWTRFMDMASGGSRKEPFAKLYIEAPESEARAIFYNRYGHNPDRVTCTCCGSDYSLDEYDTLEEASKYDRREGYGADARTVSLEAWLARGVDLNGFEYTDGCPSDTIEVIYAADIKQGERDADIPAQGFVWVD